MAKVIVEGKKIEVVETGVPGPSGPQGDAGSVGQKVQRGLPASHPYKSAAPQHFRLIYHA